MTLRTFDLFEGLDIVVLGAVHDGENFGHEMGFITRPMTACACVKRLHNDSLSNQKPVTRNQKKIFSRPNLVSGNWLLVPPRRGLAC